MYQLEDRILFDGAAVVDAAAAAQEVAAQEAAAQDAADAAEPVEGTTGAETANEASAPEQALDQYIPVDVNDVQSSTVLDAMEAAQPVKIIVVSDTLENADALIQAADDDAIVIRYNAHETTSAELLSQISEAAGGREIDSLAIFGGGEAGALEIFSDADTSLGSLDAQQAFWTDLGSMMGDNGRIDFFASNVAGSADGCDLVDAIGDMTGCTVSASTDVSGDIDAGGNWALEYTTSSDGVQDVIGDYFDTVKLDSFDHRIEEPKEVVFIGDTVYGREDIINSLGKHQEVVIISGDNALDQVNSYLAEHDDIDAIHFVTHGGDGFFRIGSQTVDQNFIEANQDMFAAWGNSLSPDGDIMIYGCNTAESAAGQGFIDYLADVTGADVAASDDATGLKGDWNLEYTAGDIQASAIAVDHYKFSLATITINSMRDVAIGYEDPGEMTLRLALSQVQHGDEIIVGIDPTQGTTISMNSELGSFVIDKNITINGRYKSDPEAWITIDGMDANRIFTIIADKYETNPETNTGTGGGTEDDPTTPGQPDNPVLTGPNSNADGAENPDDGTDTKPEIYTVTLTNLFLVKGYATSSDPYGAGNGGGIFISADSNVYMKEVQVNRCHATLDGGGIYNLGTLVIEDTRTDETTGVASCTAANSGGGIYNGVTGTLSLVAYNDPKLHVDIFSNTALNGSGGGIYTVTPITTSQLYIWFNAANNGYGGGLAMVGFAENSTDIWGTSVCNNTSGTGGGGIAIIDCQDVLLDYVIVDGNSTTGFGGGVYISHSGVINVGTGTDSDIANSISSNTASFDGGGVYIVDSGDLNLHFLMLTKNIVAQGNGGGLYAMNSGNVYLEDTEVSGNTLQNGTQGGGIWYTDNVSGKGSLILNTSSVNTNIINGTSSEKQGGGIYLACGNISLTNTTIAKNSADIGGGIYLGNGSISIVFGTLAYNTASVGSHIYVDGNGIYANNFGMANTIVYNNNEIASSSSQIRLAENRKITQFTHNIYSHYYLDQANLGANSLTVAEMGGSSIYSDRLIGTSQDKTALLQANLYLDTELHYHANERTQALALMYKDSWALSAGMIMNGIQYDQRGNNRIGFDENGIQYAAPSIGAFEPIFYLTVNSKGDDLIFNSGGGSGKPIVATDSDMRWFQWGMSSLSSANAKYLNVAMNDTNGLGLREAMFWLDTFNRQEAFDAGHYDSNRYVKFDSKVFSTTPTYDANGNLTNGNVISLEMWRLNASFKEGKHIMVGSSSDNEAFSGINYGDKADNTSMSQDNEMRITIDGHGEMSLFSNLRYDGYIILNNLTFINGYTTNSGSNSQVNGSHGAIRNHGTMILNNVVVKDCSINWTALGGSDEALGGGIYNNNVLYMYDTTVRDNSLSGAADDKHPLFDSVNGAGIFNTSTGVLTMERCTVINNTAVLSGNDYIFGRSLNGGAIYNAGELYIANSTIANNRLNNATVGFGYGSAIFNFGNMVSYYNTITGNTVQFDALAESGGVFIGFDPNRVPPEDSEDNIEYEDGELKFYTMMMSSVFTSTDISSTGGLGEIHLSNSVIAGNTMEVSGIETKTVRWANDVTVTSDAVLHFDKTGNGDGTHNAIGKIGNMPTSQEVIWRDYNILGNSTVTDGLILNLNLSTELAYNGGKTLSYRVLEGSVLFGAGTHLTSTHFSALGRDQRGVSHSLVDRNGSTAANIGSYESLTYVVVNSQNDITPDQVLTEFDYANDQYFWVVDATLRDAMYWVDAEALVVFDASSWSSGSIVLVNGQMPVMQGITIDGSLSGTNAALDRLTVTANLKSTDEAQRIFYVNNNSSYVADVQFHNIIISNGRADHGAGIYSTESVTLNNALLTGNQATGDGGGINNSIGSFTMINSVISNNTANRGGGAFLHSNLLGVNISQSSILNNVATLSGGGFYIQASDTVIDQSTFGYNIANERYGGAIFSEVSSIKMINSTVSQNTAGLAGGAIAAFAGGVLNFDFVTIANNVSGTQGSHINYGGGIYQNAGTFTATNSIFAQNYIGSIGGVHSDVSLESGVVLGTMNANAFGVTNFQAYLLNNDFNLVYGRDFVWDNEAGPHLEIATELSSEKGCNTMILYVGNNSILIGKATADGNVTVDQRGVNRPLRATIGAYEKAVQTYVFYNTLGDGDVNNLLNWADGNGLNPISFDMPNVSFVFDGDIVANVVIDKDWTIGDRASSSVINGAFVTVTANALVTANMSVINNSHLKVDGEVKGALDLTNQATLTLNTARTDNLSLTIESTTSETTVVYSYNGVQNLLVGTYGNLILNNGYKFASDMNITVNGNLTVDSNSTLDAKTITVYGSATGNGNLVASESIRLYDRVQLNTISGRYSVVLGGGGAQVSANEITSAIGSITIDAGGRDLNVREVNAGNWIKISDAANVNGTTFNASGMIMINASGNIVADSIVAGGDMMVAATGSITVNQTFSAQGVANIDAGSDIVVRDVHGEMGLYMNAGADMKISGRVDGGNGSDVYVISGGTIALNNAAVGNTDMSNFVTFRGNIVANGTSTLNSYSLNYINSANSTIEVQSGNFQITVKAAQNLLLAGHGASGNGLVFNAANLTVAEGARLGFSVGGQVSMNQISGADSDNICGTLAVAGANTIINGVEFNHAHLEFGGNITLKDDFTVIHGLTFNGNVYLDANGRDVSITSTYGFVHISGKLIALHNESVIVNGTDIQIGSAAELTDLTLNASKIDFTGGDILLNGNFVVNGNAVLTGDVKIEAKRVEIGGSLVSMIDGLFSVSTVNGAVINGNVDLNNFVVSAGSMLIKGDLRVANITNKGTTLTVNDLVLSNSSASNIFNAGVINARNFSNFSHGLTISGGKLNVAGDFIIGNTNNVVALNETVVQVGGSIQGQSMQNYFAMDSVSELKASVSNAAATDIYLAGSVGGPVSKVTLTSESAAKEFVGVGTFAPLTGNGQVGNDVLLDTSTVVNRAYRITRYGDAKMTLAITPAAAETGSGVNDKAILYFNGSGFWQAASGNVGTGVYTMAMPGTTFETASTPHGLNYFQAHDYSQGPYDIDMGKPKYDQGAKTWAFMTKLWNAQAVSNPLGGQLPPVGLTIYQMIQAEKLLETISLTGEGEYSVYGSPVGVNELLVGGMIDLEGEDTQLIDEATDYKASLESILSELAQTEYLQDTHTVFQSDVDRALEEIMAS